MLDHIFIDVTTEGESLSLASIAAFRTDRKGNLLASYHDDIARENAFGGVTLSVAMASFRNVVLGQGMASKFVYVSHYDNTRAILEKETGEHVAFDVPWFYTCQLGWPLFNAGIVPNLELDSLANAHGIQTLTQSAENSATTIMRTYWEMMRRYRSAMVAEELVRKSSGPTVEKIRSALGF